jgi:hypothetical protein
VADTSYLFVGPYAEWLVPPELWDLRFISPQPGRGRRALVWNQDTNDNYNLTVVVKRERFYRYCAMPCKKRAGHPKREMLLLWYFTMRDCPPFLAEDWSEIDRQAEVEWFRSAFAEELQQSAEQIGSEPSFRWGLVHWFIS